MNHQTWTETTQNGATHLTCIFPLAGAASPELAHRVVPKGADAINLCAENYVSGRVAFVFTTLTNHVSFTLAWTVTRKICQVSYPTPCNGYQQSITVGGRETCPS